MRFGFHISISHGFVESLEVAKSLGCETMQIFTGSQQQWRRSVIDEDDASEFKTRRKKKDISPLFVHLFYLPNFATPDRELLEKSQNALIAELDRAAMLGAEYIILHPGAYKNSTKEEGIRKVAASLDYVFGKIAGGRSDKVKVLIENTSAGGTRLGGEFEEFARIFDFLKHSYKVGVCLDTAHAFEAGYPIHTEEGLADTLEEFDRLVGLNKLHLLHLNDSKSAFSSRNDRHWHIGEGEIGIETFKRIIRHPRLKHIPAIMETPTDFQADLKNMKTVKAIRNGA